MVTAQDLREIREGVDDIPLARMGMHHSGDMFTLKRDIQPGDTEEDPIWDEPMVSDNKSLARLKRSTSIWWDLTWQPDLVF